MAWTDKILAIFRSEAKDVKEGLDGLKGKLDEELTKRETEMAATPTERLGMIEDDIKSGSSRLDEIGEEIAADTAVTKARADLDSPGGVAESLEDRLARTSDQTPDEAISEALSDAHATPEVPTEPQLTVQEQADATLDELRAELGLEADGDPSASSD